MPRRTRRDPRERVRRGVGDAGTTSETRGGRSYEVRAVAGSPDRSYRCPGCDHEVAAGVAHVVVVEAGRLDERRHWHAGCWRRDLRP